MAAISKKMLYFVMGMLLFLAAVPPMHHGENVGNSGNGAPDSFAGADAAHSGASGELVSNLMPVEPDPARDDVLGRFMLLFVLGMVGVVGLTAVLLRMKEPEDCLTRDWEMTIDFQVCPDPSRQACKARLLAASSASCITLEREFAEDLFDAIEYESAALPELPEATGVNRIEPLLIEAVDVIEQNDPLQQARFWAATGKPEVAIEILEPVLEADPHPRRWMLLLELYALTNQRQAYIALGQRFKAMFNCKLPHWGEKPAARRLLDMPDLVQRIDGMLIESKQRGAGKSVIASLNSLLLDERQGQRQGFEYCVYEDLVRLYDTVCAGKQLASCVEALA
jgi:hypothetical protein